MYKNYEGYNDSTAGKAIRRADRSKKKGVAKRDTLTYRLGELPGFKEIQRKGDGYAKI